MAVVRHAAGRRITGGATSVRRSASAMRCCVPTRCDRRRPDRIQRRTVSGLQRTRRATSGTVSMRVEYDNSRACAGLSRESLIVPWPVRFTDVHCHRARTVFSILMSHGGPEKVDLRHPSRLEISRVRCDRRGSAGTITRQRPWRERRTAHTTSGTASPVAVVCHAAGRRVPAGATSVRRSASSMKCWVPTRSDERRPERIQRLSSCSSSQNRLFTGDTTLRQQTTPIWRHHPNSSANSGRPYENVTRRRERLSTPLAPCFDSARRARSSARIRIVPASVRPRSSRSTNDSG